MQARSFGRILLASTLSVVLSSTVSFAQVKQDMKDAGHATKEAAVDTGHATKAAAKNTGHATKKAYHKTKRGTKKAWHKTENAGDRIADKPQTH